jgi:DNA helicase-2/ATP-dependent DNA helicase PcrA
MKLSNKKLEVLIEQQKKIIEAEDNLIVVSAGPGSGKTHTISNKIAKEIELLEDYQGVIACSFTRLASNELKERVESLIETKYSYIGTFDSFVLNEIIVPFGEKYVLETKNIKLNINKYNIVFPEDITLVNDLTRRYNSSSDYILIKDYVYKWFQNYKTGTFEISFPSYLFAKSILEKSFECRDYLKSRYSSIYIDEAQDLNSFQHILIKSISEQLDLKVVMIGDSNQSIYAFRGAKPQQFISLVEKGYVEYNIDISVRCHNSIMYFANKFVKPKRVINIPIDINLVKRYSSFDEIDTIDRIFSKNTLILTFSNARAEELSQLCNEKGYEVRYSKQIEIQDREFKGNYYDLIEELLLFYYNYGNDNLKLTYSYSDIIEYFENLDLFDIKLVKEFIERTDISVYDYLQGFFILIDPNDYSNEIMNIVSQLETPSHRDHYLRQVDVNRAMTIHSSKGLEADNVILIVENDWNLNEEYRRKLFVAFTRTREELHIVLQGRFNGVHLHKELDKIINEIDLIVDKK